MARLDKIVQILKDYGMNQGSTCMDYDIREELKMDESKLVEFESICAHMEHHDCNTCCLSAQEYTNKALEELESYAKQMDRIQGRNSQHEG